MGNQCPGKRKNPEPEDVVAVRPVAKTVTKKKIEQGVKFVLVGEVSCGKTCILERLTKDSFALEGHSATVAAAFAAHKMTVKGRVAKLELWDTAGQDRFRSLTPMYYRGARAALVVYDITNKASFDTMKRWVDDLRSSAPPDAIIAIVGNKCDLEDRREVDPSLARDYVAELQAAGVNSPSFHEVSAKTGTGVSALFDAILSTIIAQEDQ